MSDYFPKRKQASLLPMRRLCISQECHERIRARAIHEFRDTSERGLNGHVWVRVDEEVYQVLLSNNMPGESFSDTIIRLLGSGPMGSGPMGPMGPMGPTEGSSK